MPIYIGVFLLSVIPSKKSITLPGGIKRIESEIIIPSHVSNDFYSVYVMSYDRPTYLQTYMASLSHENDIETLTYVPSLQESIASGTLFKTLSYTNALITAYEAASLVDNNITITYDTLGYVVTYSSSLLHINDVITHIDGVAVLDRTQQAIIDDLKAKDIVTFTVLRNKVVKDITLTKQHGVFGIMFELLREIKSATPQYTYTLQAQTTYGPSGGLLQALSIYSSLLNITFDKVIAGTGTMEADHTVGAIGGVQQKVYTVQGYVDLFLVPEVNYDAALEAYNTLKNPTFKLEKVRSFHNAIALLNP